MKINRIFHKDSMIRKYVQDYKFKSVFIKNTLLLMILIMIPITGIVFLAYYSYGNMQKNEMKSYSERITFDYFSDFKRILKEAEKELSYIGFNANVELYMYDTENLRQLNYKVASIQELIRMPIITRDYVDNIFLYSEKNGKVISIEGVSNYDTFRQKEMIHDFLKNDSRVIQLTEKEPDSSEFKQLSVFHKIRYGSKVNGVAVMNLDITSLLKSIAIQDNTSLYLTDGDIILIADNKDLIGESVKKIQGYEYIKPGESIFSKNYCISSILAEQDNLEVITIMDTTGYNYQISAVRIWMIAFVIIVAVLTVILSLIVSVRIFRPIGNIVSSLRQHRNVLVGEKEQFKEEDELQYIMQTIQQTVDIKNDIDKELAERVRLLKQAQAVALQSQINPHFLNNTLETINWMAMGLLGGKNEISEMTGALSKMLRMALENTDTIIPMSMEIEHCMNYLEIQKKRYEDKFDVVWEIPDEIYQCRTIRIILQPIVENAIYHGIKPLSNKGKIIIRGQIEKDIIRLEVLDNGLGMTVQELNKLRENMKSDMIKESRHIGVANVNQRLKLYFGEKYGVFIDSKEGMGTTVTVCFPKIEAQSNNKEM